MEKLNLALEILNLSYLLDMNLCEYDICELCEYYTRI